MIDEIGYTLNGVFFRNLAKGGYHAQYSFADSRGHARNCSAQAKGFEATALFGKLI